MNILLAEDNVALRRVVSAAVRRAGHDVVECVDGAQLLECLADASEAARARRVDAVITDVNMPGATGIEVLAGLRQRGRRTDVILTTAVVSREIQDRACELGALAVLQKPFDLELLLGLLGKISRRLSPSR